MAVQLKHDIRGYHAGNISKRYLREAEAADEFEKQADSLKNVQMDVASKDTSAAAEAAEAKKKEFETMKSNYVEKLKLQMEQAETQRRNIRNRRLSGK